MACTAFTIMTVSMPKFVGARHTKGRRRLAEDPSDASIACRQVGPIRFTKSIAADTKGEPVFKARRSVLIKKLQVIRFLDHTRNTLVYRRIADLHFYIKRRSEGIRYQMIDVRVWLKLTVRATCPPRPVYPQLRTWQASLAKVSV